MNPTDWAKANPKVAAGGAGVVAVAGLAFMRSRRASAAAASPATSSAAGTDATAGTSGIPNTLATDIENAVQDQLNTFQNGVNQQIAGLKPTSTPPAPKPPVTSKPGTSKPPVGKPVPVPPGRKPTVRPTTKPAAAKAAGKSYTVPAGGTLWAAAQSIFGTANPANVAKLASQNNIKLYQRNGTTYADVYRGQVIRYQP